MFHVPTSAGIVEINDISLFNFKLDHESFHRAKSIDRSAPKECVTMLPRDEYLFFLRYFREICRRGEMYSVSRDYAGQGIRPRYEKVLYPAPKDKDWRSIPKVSIILSTDLTRQGISGVDEISKLDYLFPEGTESLQDLQAGRFRDRLERQIWWCISLRTMAAYIAQKSVLKGFFNSKWEGTLSNCIECFWSSVFVVQHLRVLFKVVPRLVILNRDITLSQGGWTISSCLTELGSFIYCRGCACNSGMTGQGVIPHGKIQSRKFTVTFFHMWLGFQEKRFWKSIWYTCTRGLQLHK